MSSPSAQELQLALVPAGESLAALAVTDPGRKTRWERVREAPKTDSLWGHPDDKPYKPPSFVDLPPGLTPAQLDQFLREQRLEELQVKVTAIPMELEMGDLDVREASPPPSYDANGSRTNTRDVRVKQAMQAEYARLVEFMIAKIPGYQPPADYRPLKRIKKIIIPMEKYPEYNFMGLIIGPRGCNHKRLEAESGCQIAVRGKGTLKEGKRTDHQTEDEANMPMHVHISADSDDKLNKAVSLIEPLLDPGHPMHEEFKKAGLEQLAVVNGFQVNRMEMRCNVCGALGHQAWECPDMQELSVKRTEVKCAICGDKGHPTSDCKYARTGGPPPPPPMPPMGVPMPGPAPVKVVDQQQLDSEYAKMMRQLEGKDEKEDEPRPITPPRTSPRETTPIKQHWTSPENLLNNSPVRPLIVPGSIRPIQAASLLQSASLQQGHTIQNLGMQNTGLQNPGLSHPNIQSHGIQSPGIQNPSMPNSGLQNSGMQRPFRPEMSGFDPMMGVPPPWMMGPSIPWGMVPPNMMPPMMGARYPQQQVWSNYGAPTVYGQSYYNGAMTKDSEFPSVKPENDDDMEI